ncbi:MAG: hypothetical protein ABIH03_11050, partial [Pseudomonadota bacterium]
MNDAVKIESKAEFFRLWRAGVLGNRPRAWETPEEAVASGVPVVAFREAGRPGGLHEFVERDRVMAAAEAWRVAGRTFSLDETAPDDHVTLQGEVCRRYDGWHGYLALRSGLRMREAMGAGLMRPLRGAAVLALLDAYLDPSSRDDLDALLDLYPDAVVEFACYDHDVGVLPN